jgi:hypothetical protein
VIGRREDRHVDADLGDQALGRSLGDTGDRVEVVTRRRSRARRNRAHQPVDLGIELGDRALQLLEVLEREADQHGVVSR